MGRSSESKGDFEECDSGATAEATCWKSWGRLVRGKTTFLHILANRTHGYHVEVSRRPKLAYISK